MLSRCGRLRAEGSALRRMCARMSNCLCQVAWRPGCGVPCRRRMSGLVLAMLAAAGCTQVPQRQLEDSRLRIQALQAENEQLRDVVLNVRSQNREMAMRASEDARRLRAQEEAIARLEQSVLAYQDERDDLAALVDEFKQALREPPVMASSPRTVDPRR